MPNAYASFAYDMGSPAALERVNERRQRAAAVAARASAVASRVTARRWPEALATPTGPMPALPLRYRGDIVRRRLAEEEHRSRVLCGRNMRVPDYVPPPTTVLYAASLVRNSDRNTPAPPPTRNSEGSKNSSTSTVELFPQITENPGCILNSLEERSRRRQTAMTDLSRGVEVSRGQRGYSQTTPRKYFDQQDPTRFDASGTPKTPSGLDGKTILRNTYKHYMEKTKSVRDGQGLMLDLAWREFEQEGRPRYSNPEVQRLRKKIKSAHNLQLADSLKLTPDKNIKRHTSDASVFLSKDVRERSAVLCRGNSQKSETTVTSQCQSLPPGAPSSRRPTKGALKLGTPKESVIRINALKKSVQIVTPPKSPSAVRSTVSAHRLTPTMDETDELRDQRSSARFIAAASVVEAAAAAAAAVSDTAAVAASNAAAASAPATVSVIPSIATVEDNAIMPTARSVVTPAVNLTADLTTNLKGSSTSKLVGNTNDKSVTDSTTNPTTNSGTAGATATTAIENPAVQGDRISEKDIKDQKGILETHPKDVKKPDSQRKKSGRREQVASARRSAAASGRRFSPGGETRVGEARVGGVLGGEGCRKSSAGRGRSPAGRGSSSVGRGSSAVGRGSSAVGRGSLSIGRGPSSVGRGSSPVGRGSSSAGHWRPAAGRGSSPAGEAIPPASPAGRGRFSAGRGRTPPERARSTTPGRPTRPPQSAGATKKTPPSVGVIPRFVQVGETRVTPLNVAQERSASGKTRNVQRILSAAKKKK